jgi:AraC-like DNA-binding protein
MLRALDILAVGAAVTTVALDLGYSSISAFISLFRRTFGATPGEYIRNAAKAERTVN